MTKRTELEVVEPSLPRLKKPHNLNEAKDRLRENRGEIAQLAKGAVKRFYEAGMLCSYVRAKIGHGNFTTWIEEHVGYHPRTVRRYMRYFEACNTAGKLLLYKTDRSKTDTLSLLPPAEEEERTRPHHEPGDSPEWNATYCAKSLFRRFENLTARRTSEERWEVLEAFNELARDFITGRQIDRDVIRAGKAIPGEEGKLNCA